MTNQNIDVIRAFHPEATIGGILKNGMFGATSDTDRFVMKKLSDGTVRFISDDSKQVLLAGVQTITDVKIFDASPLINGANYLYFDRNDGFGAKIYRAAGLWDFNLEGGGSFAFRTATGNMYFLGTDTSTATAYIAGLRFHIRAGSLEFGTSAGDSGQIEMQGSSLRINNNETGAGSDLLLYTVNGDIEFLTNTNTRARLTTSVFELLLGTNLKLATAKNATGDVPVDGYIEIQDSSGSTVKLATVA